MRNTLFLVTVLFTLNQQGASGWPMAHPVENAEALLVAGRYKEALPILRKSAGRGNPEGELYLGLMFQSGWGGAQDYTQARQWYEKAAAAKNEDAVNELGAFYQYGW